MAGTTQNMQNLTRATEEAAVGFGKLSKMLGESSQKLSQIAYLTGRTASGLSKALQAPLSVSNKFIGAFDDATKTVANFENAVYLGGQQMAIFTSNIRTTEQGMQVYRKALDKATEGTKLTTLQSQKLFQTLLDGFQGIPTADIVDDFASIQNAVAKLGLSAEETQKKIQQLNAVVGKYGELRRAMAKGDTKTATSIAGSLALEGKLDVGGYATVAQVMAQRGAGNQARSMANRRFEAEARIGMAAQETAFAIGRSDVAQLGLTGAAYAASGQEWMAQIPGYGNTAAGLSVLEGLGSLFGGGGGLSALTGGRGAGGAGGVGGAGGGDGTARLGTATNPMYVIVVSGGGGGAAGSALELAQTAGILGKGGAGNLLGKIPGVGMLSSLGTLGAKGVPLTGAIGTKFGAAGAGTALGGAATLGALAAAIAGIAAIGQSLTAEQKVGSVGKLGVGHNFLSSWTKSMGIQRLMGAPSAEEEAAAMGPVVSAQDYTKVRGEVEDIAAQILNWRNNNAILLEKTKEIASIYSSMESAVSGRVGYSADAAKFAQAEAESLRQNITLRQEELSLLKQRYEQALAGGDEAAALAAKKAMLDVESELYSMSVKRADQELRSKTAVLDAAYELQRQEMELSKVIRDRNIEARLGIGVSYEDQLKIVQDIAGQIPILEQKMKQQLNAAAKERAKGTAEGRAAALDFEKQAKDTQIQIEQTKVEFFKESKAVREGYLDAFKENVFGAGGFAKILPKVGAGNQFFADIAPLGGVGQSAVEGPGKYTTSGLQVSDGYGSTVDYLNRDVNAQLYGALQGAGPQGGLDPLAEQALEQGNTVVERTANASEKTNQTVNDLLSIISGATSGNAVNVRLASAAAGGEGGSINLGFGGLNQAANISYAASPNIPTGSATAAPFMSPEAALASAGGRTHAGGANGAGGDGFGRMTVADIMNRWVSTDDGADRALFAVDLHARRSQLDESYDSKQAALASVNKEWEELGFSENAPPEVTKLDSEGGSRYLKWKELKQKRDSLQTNISSINEQRGILHMARAGIESYESTGSFEDARAAAMAAGQGRIYSSAETSSIESLRAIAEEKQRAAGVFGMSADAMNAIRSQDRFSSNSEMAKLNEAYIATRNVENATQRIGLDIKLYTEDGLAGESSLEYNGAIGSSSNVNMRGGAEGAS